MGKSNNTELTARLMGGGKKRKKSGGDAKHGRNKVKCAYYRTSRYVRNKLRKLSAHITVHVNDSCALKAKERVSTLG